VVPGRRLPADPAERGQGGVLVAWGYDETGQRVLLDVVLGQRERFERWRWAGAWSGGGLGRRC
jgi:hypothetical protein